MSHTPLNIVVLISGSGSNLQAIINAIQTEQLHANIKAVISNRPGAGGLQRAEAEGIPALTLDHTQFASREQFDQALQEKIDLYQPDIVVLAGFMRILSDDFVTHFAEKMLNIHPSLLPKYRGLNTHQRALDAGDKQHGVSIHFVSNELDGGPLVLQAVIDVNHDDNVETLQQRIHQQEHVIYPMVLQWLAQGRISIEQDKVYLDSQLLQKPAQWINNQLIC